MDVDVTDTDAFLDYAWELGWLDERFGDEPKVDPDPRELAENLLMLGFVREEEGQLIDEQGSVVPGVVATDSGPGA